MISIFLLLEVPGLVESRKTPDLQQNNSVIKFPSFKN